MASVHMPEDIIERLDTLRADTDRSRGLYLRLVATAMLPQLGDVTGSTPYCYTCLRRNVCCKI